MSLEPTILSIPSLSEEEKKARNKMSIIIGLILSAVVVSFYVVTLIKLQGNVAQKLILDKAAAVRQTGAIAPVLKSAPALKNTDGNKGQTQ
ncbi:MAG: hypothetical protein L3J67_02040 [Hyphomicrobiaceae bacterium]|nr:hypothetical protein [Hyphomicrobiaceae bacterium]